MGNQLDLFSFFNQTSGLALDLLADLDFIQAEKKWKEVLDQDPGDKDAARALELIKTWRKNVEEINLHKGDEKADFLNIQLEQFVFNHTSPDKVLFKSLKKLLQAIMIENGIFQLRNGDDIIDISDDPGKDDLIFSFLKRKLEIDPSDSRMQCRFADLLWIKGENAAAKKNYARASLSEHHRINIEKIENSALKEITKTYGTEMAYAYALTLGELPFIRTENAGNEKCYEICTLLVKESSLSISERRNEVLMLRKRIKDLDSKFFSFYLKHKSFFGK